MPVRADIFETFSFIELLPIDVGRGEWRMGLPRGTYTSVCEPVYMWMGQCLHARKYIFNTMMNVSNGNGQIHH